VSVDCRIVIEYPDERAAIKVLRAIEQDNGSHASSHVEGRELILQASARSESSMVHTLDDLLSCVKVADEMIRRITP
jgi:tRNA threonylcarbamoyladenosine modification (KEOPS) complex  Pcc1 subunit